MVFTTDSGTFVGNLVGSKRAFVTQKDVTREDGVKVRYISDPETKYTSE